MLSLQKSYFAKYGIYLLITLWKSRLNSVFSFSSIIFTQSGENLIYVHPNNQMFKKKRNFPECCQKIRKIFKMSHAVVSTLPLREPLGFKTSIL
jgi:hypothetical protein